MRAACCPGWRITSPGQPHEIAGYTDHASALPGTVVRLFVATTAPSFRVLALRFGWYGGTLARLVWTSARVRGTRQPAAAVEAHGMVEASWRPSLSLPTAGWPPGSYLLRLDASSGARQYVPLVIRSPSVAGRVVLVQPTPRPIQILASSPQNCADSGRPVLADVTYYVAASGAGVLDVGTESWSCGLPTVAMVTDRCLTISPPAAEVRVIERATRNIFETFARGPSGRVHPATDFLTGQVSR